MVAPLFLKLACVNMRARPPIKVLQIQARAPARLSSSRHDLHIKESIEQAGQTVKGAEPSSKSDFTPLRCCNSSPPKHTHTQLENKQPRLKHLALSLSHKCLCFFFSCLFKLLRKMSTLRSDICFWSLLQNEELLMGRRPILGDISRQY